MQLRKVSAYAKIEIHIMGTRIRSWLSRGSKHTALLFVYAVCFAKDILRSRGRPQIDQEKGGIRQNGSSGSLEERNANIIRRYLETLGTGIQRPHNLDDSVRNCIQEIATAEGRLSEAPNHVYLRKWSQNARPDLKALAVSLNSRFSNRLNELAQRENETKMHTLQEKYSALITAFYVVAERKVSLRDDYGDERWDALDKEIERVLCKIAAAEDRSDRRDSEWKKYPSLRPKEYQLLSTFLARSFKETHQKKKAVRFQAVDCSKMSGVEFEIYLSGLLRQLGFTDIRNTPTTNDQGADLLAKRNGRTVVIQAKRYGSPVGNGAVQQVVGALHFYSGDEGWVVTNSTFTRSAKELAQRTGIKLIDGHELVRLSNERVGE
jgi:HJR/Mrr/RecB family endonuclease